MTKTRIVNGILSGMLALYAVFIFVVTKYPRLTNFNDSFYFINWWALPLLTILLLISWIVTFKHDSSFFAFKCISIAPCDCQQSAGSFGSPDADVDGCSLEKQRETRIIK